MSSTRMIQIEITVADHDHAWSFRAINRLNSQIAAEVVVFKGTDYDSARRLFSESCARAIETYVFEIQTQGKK